MMARMATAAVLAAALLAACAPRGGGELTDQEFCSRQAENDPAVKALIIKGVGNPHFAIEGQEQMKVAKQDATLACLRSRGVIRPGGVERQKPL